MTVDEMKNVDIRTVDCEELFMLASSSFALFRQNIYSIGVQCDTKEKGCSLYITKKKLLL